jgi:hypothetical protein
MIAYAPAPNWRSPVHARFMARRQPPSATTYQLEKLQ